MRYSAIALGIVSCMTLGSGCGSGDGNVGSSSAEQSHTTCETTYDCRNNQLYTCSDGIYTVAESCGNRICNKAAGTCDEDVCSDSDPGRCEANKYVFCEGGVEKTTDCGAKSCAAKVVGGCYDACDPTDPSDSPKCQGDSSQVCTTIADGVSGWTFVPCGTDQVCREDGKCVDTCPVSDARSCRGDDLLTCTALTDGTLVWVASPCNANQVCRDDGKCLDTCDVPNASACRDNDRMVCATLTDGTLVWRLDACGTDHVCRGGGSCLEKCYLEGDRHCCDYYGEECGDSGNVLWVCYEGAWLLEVCTTDANPDGVCRDECGGTYPDCPWLGIACREVP